MSDRFTVEYDGDVSVIVDAETAQEVCAAACEDLADASVFKEFAPLLAVANSVAAESDALRARVSSLEAQLKSVREALERRQLKGHQDTCSHALGSQYDCDCGYDHAKEILISLALMSEKKAVSEFRTSRSKIRCTEASHDAFRRSADFQTAAAPPKADAMRYPWGELQVFRNCPHCNSTITRIDDAGDPENWKGDGDYVFFKNGREINRKHDP